MLKFSLSTLEDIREINRLSNDTYPRTSVYFTAKEEDKLRSYCVLLIQEKAGELIDIQTTDKADKPLAFAMAKAAFNTLDLCGIHWITSQNKELEELLFSLGFVQKGEGYELDLAGYFTPCTCKGKKLAASEKKTNL